MGITVKIEKDDQGQFSVGVDAGDQDEGMAAGKPMMPGMSMPPEAQEDSGMQTVASIDEALSIAKDLLSGQTGAQSQDAMAAQTAFTAA
jgi:hypothetical protein